MKSVDFTAGLSSVMHSDIVRSFRRSSDGVYDSDGNRWSDKHPTLADYDRMKPVYEEDFEE